MSGNLEERLGEVGGRLKSLIPALENLEKRVNDNRDKVTVSETNISNMKNKIDSLEKKIEAKGKQTSDRIFEVVKLAVAAILGAIAGAISGGLG